MGSASSTSSKPSPAEERAVERLNKDGKLPVYGPSSIMSQKGHGTYHKAVQRNLRWGCQHSLADRICNYNRHYAENSGYFRGQKQFLKACAAAAKKNETIQFADSNTGKVLFEAPKNRTMDDFLAESRRHGWPSFRDAEVNWTNVRCLRGGECVSVDGTHLGHNLPDRANRYCINLVSVAGRPVKEEQ